MKKSLNFPFFHMLNSEISMYESSSRNFLEFDSDFKQLQNEFLVVQVVNDSGLNHISNYFFSFSSLFFFFPRRTTGKAECNNKIIPAFLLSISNGGFSLLNSNLYALSIQPLRAVCSLWTRWNTLLPIIRTPFVPPTSPFLPFLFFFLFPTTDPRKTE